MIYHRLQLKYYKLEFILILNFILIYKIDDYINKSGIIA